MITRRRAVALLTNAPLLAACSGTEPAASTSAPSRFTGAAAAPPRELVRFRDATLAQGYGADQTGTTFPRTVRHAGGSTAIERPPARIAILSGGQLDALVSLGLVPGAATHGQDAALVPDYLRRAAPDRAGDLDRIRDLGARTAPDLEAVAAAEPDLIIGNRSGVGDLAPQLGRIAPLVLTDGDPVNWRSDYLLLAAALGLEDQARQVLTRLSADVEAWAGRLAERPVVSLIRFQGDRIRALGTGATAGMVLAEAGLARPAIALAGEVSVDVAAEQLTEVDADWILYGTLGETAAAAPEQVAGALWPTLLAVRNGRARSVDDAVWFQNAGPVASRAVLDQLAELIKP